jgi:hypothetical protein
MREYQDMLRDVVRDQGAPESFRANAAQLTYEQLAIALREYDDVMPEVAGEIAESVRDCLKFGKASSFVQLFPIADLTNDEAIALAIGVSFVAGCRRRVMSSVRRDLELKASDMEIEDRTDAEVEHA